MYITIWFGTDDVPVYSSSLPLRISAFFEKSIAPVIRVINPPPQEKFTAMAFQCKLMPQSDYDGVKIPAAASIELHA